MSRVFIAAIAYDQTGQRFDSLAVPPKVNSFVEHVHPHDVPQGWLLDDELYYVDNSDHDCVVEASPHVSVSSGDILRSVPFAMWRFAGNLFSSSISISDDIEFECPRGKDLFLVALYSSVVMAPVHIPHFTPQEIRRRAAFLLDSVLYIDKLRPAPEKIAAEPQPV